MVGGWLRIRVTATRWSAALARRWPPRQRRWREVLPLEAGIGQTPQSLANAASERMRSGSSPKTTSSSAGRDARQGRQVRRPSLHQALEVGVVFVDLGVEIEPSLGERSKRLLGGGCRRGELAGVKGREVPGQCHV